MWPGITPKFKIQHGKLQLRDRPLSKTKCQVLSQFPLWFIRLIFFNVTFSPYRDLINSLSQAQVSDLALGAAALETISSALTSSVQRAIPSGAFSSRSSGGNTIDFGTALGDM